MNSTAEYYKIVDEAFRKLAPYYDALIWPLSQMRDRITRLAPIKDGSLILDVATGTGAQAIAFARRGHTVVGVDLSDAMLAIARRKNRYVNLRFEVANGTHLHFPADIFDVSTISFALHDMPRSIGEQVLTEMARVTKPGGTIVIVDYALPGTRVGKALVYRLVEMYEGKYYREFIRLDLRAWLNDVGIPVAEEISILAGAARILIANA